MRPFEAVVFPKSIATALVAAQQEVRAVNKSSTNKFHGYDYAPAEDVIEEGKRALNKSGLSFVMREKRSTPTTICIPSGLYDIAQQESDPKKPLMKLLMSLLATPTRIEAMFDLAHVDGDHVTIGPFSAPVVVEAGRAYDKAEFAAETELKAYAYLAILGLKRGAEGVAAREDREERTGEAAPSKTFVAAMKAAQRAKGTDDEESVRDQVTVSKMLTEGEKAKVLAVFA